jgi:uncharacterized protein (DUF302 family)
MNYYISTVVNDTFDSTIDRVTEQLNAQGFGVLSDIDVKATLEKKLGAVFRDYRILGACNPPFAHRALQTEDKIGTMLPCNVVVQSLPDGRVEVAAVNPVVSMQGIENPELEEIAGEIRSRLQTAIENV